MRARLSAKPPDLARIRLVAGADVSFDRGEDRMFSAVVVYDLGKREIVETKTASRIVAFPYVPGYLSFREGFPLVAAFGKLKRTPDAAVFDGQGIAHPRGFGLAAHIGVALDIPTVGCAKSVLVGAHTEPPDKKGAYSPLVYDGKTVGAALRTRENVKCVFVSPGHRMDLDSAVAIVLAATGRYRLPEPIRAAHKACNELRRSRGRGSGAK